MLYRKMPKTGDELSILGFGCMRLPTDDKQNIDEARAISQIRHCIDQGMNYFDTAWPYHNGASEPLLGKALAGGYRDKVRVATKLPPWKIKTRADMDHYLGRQLEKLQTDRIDYYLLHALNGQAWDRLAGLGAIDFMDKALADGRIKNAGFSFHGVLPDFKRIVDAYPWNFCQIQYNYLDVDYQAGTKGLKYAASKGLGVIIMEPLRGGNLTADPQPPAVDKIWQTAEVKRTPAEWALRWIWNHPEVTVVLSGMNDEANIEENLAIADAAHPGSLSQTECEIVEKVAAKYRELMKVGCTGCGYCMPCPEGVKIPGMFEIYNRIYLFNNLQSARMSYAFQGSGVLTATDPGFASQCVQCGECLEKCPQGIDIPAMLEKVVEELEGEELESVVEGIRERLSAE
jgi:predicted aldo/keto reductase-like oxidoreductase